MWPTPTHLPIPAVLREAALDDLQQVLHSLGGRKRSLKHHPIGELYLKFTAASGKVLVLVTAIQG